MTITSSALTFNLSCKILLITVPDIQTILFLLLPSIFPQKYLFIVFRLFCFSVQSFSEVLVAVKLLLTGGLTSS